MKSDRTIEDILKSTSSVLFPEEFGNRKVELDTRDCDGDTPLHVMAGRNDRVAVEMLIEAGADINALGDMGETPLHVATRRESLLSMEALLFSGAKTNIKNEFGENVQEAVKRKGGKIEKIFRKYRRN